MKLITSKDNPIVKNLVKLTDSKGRAELGLCIIVGTKLVAEHMDKVSQIFIRQDDSKKPQEKINFFQKNPKDLFALPPSIFNKIAIFDTDIIATVPIPKSGNHSSPFVILDRIQDPGNLGTILRTAAAFGYQTIYTIDCADPFSQKSIRSAMGTQFKLNIHKFSPEYIKDAKLYIADLDGHSIQDIGFINLQPFGIILGNEGRGVSEELKKLPHTVVTIPMQNVESLNVAVAAGIILHALRV